jgi:hypothetical protein
MILSGSSGRDAVGVGLGEKAVDGLLERDERVHDEALGRRQCHVNQKQKVLRAPRKLMDSPFELLST